VLYIPMVHGTEIVREGYFGSRVHAHYDLGYVVPFCLVLTFVALFTTRWVARRVVPE
jgi:ABC-type polysaccharide/polyol phosphate export permease